MESPTPHDLIAFWSAAGRGAWFRKVAAFDAALKDRFEAAHLAASRGELGAWGETAEGALALVLLLDQVPRNIYRGLAQAYATDALAREAADGAIAAGYDLAAPPALPVFFYLPFAHGEDAVSQARSLALFAAYAARSGDEGSLRDARRHAAVIAQFGRFPHRNAVLGRTSTPAEIAFLAGGGFKG